MKLTRKDYWQDLLAEYIEFSPKFRWGIADCCLWASNWVKMATQENVDFADIFAGEYSTALGAARILKEHSGAEGIADLCLEPIENKFYAQRGDLLLYHTSNDTKRNQTNDLSGALGICVGAEGAFLTAAGLAFKPINVCEKAWKV